jgi:hypothetical protein
LEQQQEALKGHNIPKHRVKPCVINPQSTFGRLSLGISNWQRFVYIQNKNLKGVHVSVKLLLHEDKTPEFRFIQPFQGCGICLFFCSPS